MGEDVTAVPGEALIGRAFCDWTLTAIAWREEGVDLEVELPDREPALPGVTTARLVCRWLDSLEITTDGTQNPGAPLTWDGSVTRRARGGFRLVLDLGCGAVTVECAHLDLRRR